MKILICTGFSLFGTGSGTLIRTQTDSFLKHGDEVAIVSCENNTDSVTKDDGVKYYPVYFTSPEKGAEHVEGAYHTNFPMFTGSTVSTENFWDIDIDDIKEIMERYQTRVAEAMKEFKPDIIFANHLWLHSYLAMKVANGQIPVVTTIHGTDLKGYGEKIPEYLKTATPRDAKKLGIYKKCAEEAARMGNKFVVISDAQDARFKELYPEFSDKAVLVRNSYDSNKFYRITDRSREEIIDDVFGRLKGHNDPETFGMPDDPNATELPRDFDKLSVFVGKFVEFKGVDSLIHGWKKVEEQMEAGGKKPLLLIVGAGPLDKKLREEAKKVGTKNLYFVGRQGPDIINPLQNIADCAQAPSIQEPDGLVVKEALAGGNPVIGGNSGGIPETLTLDDGKTLIDPEHGVYQTSLGMLIENEITREIKPDATDEELEASKLRAGDSIAAATLAIFQGRAIYDRGTLAKIDYENYSPDKNYSDLMEVFHAAQKEVEANRGSKKKSDGPDLAD